MRKPFFSLMYPDKTGYIFDPPLGGYGPWRSLPLVQRERAALYLSIPLHMSRKQLRAQYVWASESADRSAYLPSKRFAPK